MPPAPTREPFLWVLCAISTLMVALGLFAFPYSFYMLLRVVICLTAIVGLSRAGVRKLSNWLWIYAVAAVLYNPIVPIRLGSKPMWIALNVATIVILWVGLASLRKAPVPGSQDGLH